MAQDSLKVQALSLGSWDRVSFNLASPCQACQPTGLYTENTEFPVAISSKCSEPFQASACAPLAKAGLMATYGFKEYRNRSQLLMEGMTDSLACAWKTAQYFQLLQRKNAARFVKYRKEVGQGLCEPARRQQPRCHGAAMLEYLRLLGKKSSQRGQEEQAEQSSIWCQWTVEDQQAKAYLHGMNADCGQTQCVGGRWE